MANDDRIEQELTRLFHERRPGLLAQIDVLCDYRYGLTGAEKARESAHRLAGTLGLFGLSDLGRQAAQLEADLSEGTSRHGSQLDDFIERAVALLRD